jgi:hypothetical protein
MIGGSPMMSPNVFPSPFPGQLYPAAQYVGQPASWQTPNANRAAPQPAAAVAPATAPRPVVARAKGPDEPLPSPTPARLTMPSPEQLGVARPKPAADGVDWTATRQRLDRLGATCFHLERLSPQAYRFTCLLPTTQPGRTHHVEAVAATEAEAVRLTLAKSEEWAAGR